MALVFQDFVRNFLRLEQAKYDVGALQLEWDAIGDPASTSILPTMVTDIFLSNPTEKIIVDTKYYSETMQERFGKRSIHSDNLYQLFSYLKNAEARGAEYHSTKGVLLYPTVGSDLDARVFVQGHEVRAVTLNLNQPWQKVRQDILATFQ